MYRDKFKLLKLAFNQLTDEESRRWFDVRWKYLVDRDGVALLDNIHDCFDAFHPDTTVTAGDVANLCNDHYKDKPIFIFGTGSIARHTYWNIAHSILYNRFQGFVNSHRNITSEQHTLKDGRSHKILLPMEAYETFSDAIFIICSETYAYEMYRQISKQGIPQENIYIPTARLFSGSIGYQYFDVFTHEIKEVFLDVGCFDGITSLQFIKWCDMDYERIVCFEPDLERIKICKKTFSENNIKKVEIVPACCWNEIGEVFFSDDNQMSMSGTAAVIQAGNSQHVIKMKADTIDHILDGNPASFIKMDIEGSELAALHGAQNTIRKYHPKLAISIYHKPEDIIEIPSYIMDLNPNYRLTIRHYTSLDNETVLYAE